MEATLTVVESLDGIVSMAETLTGAIDQETITADISDTTILDGILSELGTLSSDISAAFEIASDITLPKTVGGDPYQGSYEVTPTQETQVLETRYLVMNQNVTINPIPSNYGLITWNGATLTVS